MSSFQAVNTTLAVPEPPPGRSGEETTPTTPRPDARFHKDSKSGDEARIEDPSLKTPTRNSFIGIAGQRPLPSSPFTPARELSETPSTKSNLSRGQSHTSTQSVDTAEDVQMGEGDDDDDKDGSDNDSVTSESGRPSKKKKGQRFFCTEFPPCNLSFTRSEHLARHIRKHTGERPFQCHCSRRFSRLDNLRQHAQTVHVNEDIPAESLAATGTRFQRQIRTDRVRPPGPRSRANTLGSMGGHSRGHSRNLSTSSITSTISAMSVAQSPDSRRRPPPLAMASDDSARARLSLQTMEAYNPPLMGSPGPQIVEYDSQSNAPTTPTSAMYSTVAGSPAHYGSAMQSPASTSSRPVSWAGPPPGRRLSNSNPFSGPPGQVPPPYMSPLQSSAASTFSTQSSVYGSPVVSNFPGQRRESNADADWRRRTWHPGTYTGPRPATSGLGYHQTPDADRPSYTSQPAASQTRLPGIESFDYAPPPVAISRPQPGPGHIDAPQRPLTYHAPIEPLPGVGHRKRMSVSWEDTMQRGINRLDITGSASPRESWSQYPTNGQPATTRPMTAPHGYFSHQQPSHVPQPLQIHPADSGRSSQELPATPRKSKRQAWYNGPVSQPAGQPVSQPVRAIQRTSPEDSSSSEGVPTPGNTTMSEYHPAILHSNGFVEAHPPGAHVDEYKPAASIMDRPHPLHTGYQSYHRHTLSNSSSSSTYRPQREPERASATFGQPSPPAGVHDMRRLDALVAVATGEHQAVENRS
ncbi:hypothetical protein EKO04_005475 [Ascochyta lentis]|uniref:C2H2-type domain-containing protein n=1 Tax=Ascochyta lentis TaxID=205686 RepID=A0A8H7MDU9_9PLEO|nr:hypothetical protein EKO04_005475 [Ascochyta lentis]